DGLADPGEEAAHAFRNVRRARDPSRRKPCQAPGPTPCGQAAVTTVYDGPEAPLHRFDDGGGRVNIIVVPQLSVLTARGPREPSCESATVPRCRVAGKPA